MNSSIKPCRQIQWAAVALALTVTGLSAQAGTVSPPSLDVHEDALTSSASELRERYADRLVVSTDTYDVYHDVYRDVPAYLTVTKEGDKIAGARLSGYGRWDVINAAYKFALKQEHISSTPFLDVRTCGRANFDDPQFERADLEYSKNDDGAVEIHYADLNRNAAAFEVLYGAAPTLEGQEKAQEADRAKHLAQLSDFGLNWAVQKIKLAPNDTTPTRPCAYYKGHWDGLANRLGHRPHMVSSKEFKAEPGLTLPVFGELTTQLYGVKTSHGRTVEVYVATTAGWPEFEKTITALEASHGSATDAADDIDRSGRRYSFRAWAPAPSKRGGPVIAMNFEQKNGEKTGEVKILITTKPFDEDIETQLKLISDPRAIAATGNN